jgi:murein L,D-transpeptidase YafK
MRWRWLVTVIASLVGLAGLAAWGHLRGHASPPPRHASEQAAASLPARAPVKGDRVVVIHKADRVLGLYRAGRLTASYPIALGRNAEGAKQKQGDGRTPEGTYFVCTRNPRSQFHLFLGLSYPNTADAKAARRAGLITEKQERSIVAAEAKRRQPPWDTPLGGEVGMHGGGVARDWTLGCIALEDDAIDELWAVLKVGDPVVIGK